MPEFKFSRRASQKKFGASYPQGVRVPPVKNCCFRRSLTTCFQALSPLELNSELVSLLGGDACFSTGTHPQTTVNLVQRESSLYVLPKPPEPCILGSRLQKATVAALKLGTFPQKPGRMITLKGSIASSYGVLSK